MPKINVAVEHRVIVEPKAPWLVIPRKDETERQAKSRLLRDACQDIVQAINRHIDDVANAYYDVLLEEQCSYCGSIWTEDSPAYNGGCCDADEQHSPTTETPTVPASNPAGENHD